jgi:Ca2+/Na+ antiporter
MVQKIAIIIGILFCLCFISLDKYQQNSWHFLFVGAGLFCIAHLDTDNKKQQKYAIQALLLCFLVYGLWIISLLK